MRNKKEKNNQEQNNLQIRSSTAEYLTYIASNGENQNTFEVHYEDENIWLTQK